MHSYHLNLSHVPKRSIISILVVILGNRIDSFVAENNILGFQIQMDETFAMNEVDRFDNLPAEWPDVIFQK